MLMVLTTILRTAQEIEVELIKILMINQNINVALIESNTGKTSVFNN
jgi:hypothetical protein